MQVQTLLYFLILCISSGASAYAFGLLLLNLLPPEPGWQVKALLVSSHSLMSIIGELALGPKSSEYMELPFPRVLSGYPIWLGSGYPV